MQELKEMIRKVWVIGNTLWELAEVQIRVVEQEHGVSTSLLIEEDGKLIVISFVELTYRHVHLPAKEVGHIIHTILLNGDSHIL